MPRWVYAIFKDGERWGSTMHATYTRLEHALMQADSLSYSFPEHRWTVAEVDLYGGTYPTNPNPTEADNG